MSGLNDLQRAVGQVLASARIGQPVFVRAHGFQHSLTDLQRLVDPWLGDGGQTQHTLHSTDHEHQVALRAYPQGQSALISATPSASRAQIDLLILGQRGAIYHTLDEYARLPLTAPVVSDRTPARPHGVLLVTGSHTHQEDYALAFAADARCRLLALTDELEITPRRGALNERLALALNIPYEPDLTRALALPGVDIVSICAEPERRGRIARRCAEAGHHLYLDKSLTPGLDEADALVAAVQQAGVCTQMFSFVTQPWAQAARAYLASGELGQLRAIHADVLFAKGPAGTATLGVPRRETYPPERHQLITAKREFDNVGVYPLVLIPWLTGHAFANIHGRTANYFFAEHQRQDVEDFGLLVGTLDNGLAVSVAAGRCGWNSHVAGGVHRYYLLGTRGTLLVDAHRPRLEVHAAEAPWLAPADHPEDPMGFWTSTYRDIGGQPKKTWIGAGPTVRPDVHCFVDRLAQGCSGDISVREAAQATEALLATYRSAATHATITLPLARGR